MTRPTRPLLALFIAISACVAQSFAQTTHSFGPGRAQLIASGGNEIVLDASGKQAALRFIAETDGSLDRIRFASRIGEGWAAQRGARNEGIFSAALFEDASGRPGSLIANASGTFAESPGARAREVRFTDVTVKAGRAYHLVISAPESGARISVNSYQMTGRGIQSLNSHDMETIAEGGDVLASNDGGATWSQLAKNAIGIMAVEIGGRIQGWAYTGAHDAMRIWHTAGGDRQSIMQSFRFSTAGRGASATATQVRIALRAQGKLANRTVPVRLRLLDASSNQPLAETVHQMETGDAARFYTQEITLPAGVKLENDTAYLLAIDLPEPSSADKTDFLFSRALSWGFGDPSLNDATWQGAEYSALTSPGDSPTDRQPLPRVDLPFILDYTLTQ